MTIHTEQIRVRGLVQGVGFRPTVWRIANALSLQGDVINDGDGVLIRVCGAPSTIDVFCRQLQAECPPLAKIDSLDRQPHAALCGSDGFVIASSKATTIRTGVVADAATCDACRNEIFDPSDRRYRYPFTNCTHCGPRLSIIQGIPYDRANTSMAPFTQCAACQAEYDDPADRRFHAQPNACPVCGPQVWLVEGTARHVAPSADKDVIAQTAALLADGQIVAIKGIGGFHLACDASNAAAVQTLRERKQRYAKPFALMADSLQTIARYVVVNDAAEALLRSPAAPIVLLDRQPTAPALAPGVAPGQDALGFMLPYSPLHHLLLADWQALRPGTPLVMTSGNLSDEPQCTENDEAGQRLATIADYQLLHDRKVVNRVDDSVVRIDAGQPRLLRRARGYAPTPLKLPAGFEGASPLLALGAELKNTFCLLRDGQAVVSQHLGDLEDARSSDAGEQALTLYQELYQHRPQTLVVDHHPDYRSTRHGRELAKAANLPVIDVQHHHAHIAAVMGDAGHPLDAGPVLGIALDGLGMGSDGTLWGGEFMQVDYRDFERLAHFPAVPLPGGTRALLEPWRNTWSQLQAHLGWDQVVTQWGELEAIQWLEQQPLRTLAQMVERDLNAPLSSSCGRLFDAVAGLLGQSREKIVYEGQAAIELEVLARQAKQETGAYPIPMINGAPTLTALWTDMLNDLAKGVTPSIVAARFHNGLAAAIVEIARHWGDVRELQDVALSGGVFQNRALFERVDEGLREAGFTVLSHRQLPSNDGCIAFGQALVGAARNFGH